MAKNKRKRAQKVRRQAANLQRQRSRERRRQASEDEQRAAQLFDPETPIETVAELMLQVYADRVPTVGLARLLIMDRTVDDMVAIARVLRERTADRPHLTAVMFSAQAAYLAGDHRAARSALDEAFGLDPELDPADRASYLQVLGRPSEAAEAVLDNLPQHINDPQSAATYEYAVEECYRRITDDAVQTAGGECPCGTGRPWRDCCRDRDLATVERFENREGLYALRSALREFVETSDFGPAVDAHVRDWLSHVEAESWEDSAQEGLERLAIEHAWTIAGLTDAESDEDNALFALAEDPRTDPEIATAARLWRENVRYGLWQIEDPSTRPGVHCVELCTGYSMYVAFAPEQLEQVPRWSVLLGAIVPLDGAWRATGSMMSVTPTEADSLIDHVQLATEELVHHLAGDPIDNGSPAPPGQAEPHSVYAYWDDEAAPSTAKFIGSVTGSLLPRLLSDVRRARETPPTLTNTDGDLMEMITATIAVADQARVFQALAKHPDFELRDDTSITWYGSVVPEGQRTALLAEARAQLGDTALADDAPNSPQRWLRAQLTVDGETFRVEVNSRRRLDRLIKIIDRFGGRPAVIDETRIDPKLDLPWIAGHRPARGGAAAPQDGWENSWLSEPVPALGGLTPVEAANSDYRAHLEALLRQLEYDADLVAATGERGVDTKWLREKLGMRY